MPMERFQSWCYENTNDHVFSFGLIWLEDIHVELVAGSNEAAGTKRYEEVGGIGIRDDGLVKMAKLWC